MSEECAGCKNNREMLTKLEQSVEGLGALMQDYKDAIHATHNIAGFLLLNLQIHDACMNDDFKNPRIINLLRQDIDNGPLSESGRQFARRILAGVEMSWKLTLEASKGGKSQ